MISCEQAYLQAIEIAGSKAAIARHLGITPQTMTRWRRVPAHHVMAVVELVEGQVTPRQLRPDVFGPEAA